MKLKLKGSEAAAGVGTGNGSNVGSATLVRVHNSGSTDRVVSLETSANVIIGSFSIGGGGTEYLEKDPTDEVFAAHAEILLVAVAYYS